MVKTFKRIAALAMAIALVVCFAVSASAVDVSTTTTYVTGDETKVNVSVSVTDYGAADYVTYYAYNGSTPVFIDQVDGSFGSAVFNFQTAATNLNSAVKVGYTAADSATSEYITANTITYNGTVLATLPTATTTATVTIEDYTLESGMTVGSVSADANATVGTFAYTDGSITVQLTNISGDVVLTVTETAVAEDTSIAKILDAGMVMDGDARKLTVLGAATGTDEYGVIISTAEIKDTYTDGEIATLTENSVAFKAEMQGTNGVFAVQVIDNATDGDGEILIAANESYNVAVYVKTSNGQGYKVAKRAEVVTLTTVE